MIGAVWSFGDEDLLGQVKVGHTAGASGVEGPTSERALHAWWCLGFERSARIEHRFRKAAHRIDGDGSKRAIARESSRLCAFRPIRKDQRCDRAVPGVI